MSIWRNLDIFSGRLLSQLWLDNLFQLLITKRKQQNLKLGLVQRTIKGKDRKARVPDWKVGKKIFRKASQRPEPLEIRNSSANQASQSTRNDSEDREDGHK